MESASNCRRQHGRGRWSVAGIGLSLLLLLPTSLRADSDYPEFITPGARQYFRELEAEETASAYPAEAVSVPEYVYEPTYYSRLDLGARPAADYGPAGYIEREYQDAPGVPEYQPLSPPLAVTQAERDRYVTGGMFPGSFLAPGTNTSMRLRGFVRLIGNFDFNSIGSTDSFVTNRIPVPAESGQNSTFSARFSRIALETWTPTTYCDWNVHTMVELDFFSGNPPAVGAGNPARLRLAFADFGYFRIGQQNSVFMDASAFPSTTDFAGPRGRVIQRRAAFRVTLPINDQLDWAAELGQPFSDITTHNLGENVQDVPDFATHLHYQADAGHLQLATMVRSIGYRPMGESVLHQTAWGVNLSSNFHPWAILRGIDPVHTEDPSGWVRSRVLLQYAVGQGIGRYIHDTANLGLDGQVDPLTGQFSLPTTTGWSVSYEHWFNEHWLCNTTYSAVDVQNVSGQPAETYAAAHNLGCSLWWIPMTNMSIGLEYLHGMRENLDQQHAQANRLQALFQYNF